MVLSRFDDGDEAGRWNSPPDEDFGPAYLAALGVVVVIFGLGLATAGLIGRGPWTRWLSLIGLGTLAIGVVAMGVAAWLVGGPPKKD